MTQATLNKSAVIVPMLLTELDMIKIVDFNLCPICEDKLVSTGKRTNKCKHCNLIATTSENAEGDEVVAVKRPSPRHVSGEGFSLRTSPYMQ